MAGDDETLKREPTEESAGSRSRSGPLRELLTHGTDELSPRYEVRGVLGQGGMGQVLEAFDRRLRREVAIKVLRFADPDAADVQRFVREAQISSRLDHPHVLPVHDLGVGPDGSVFFAMKRLRGRTLTELLRTEPPTLHRRLDIFLKVCDAVAYAHHRGVMHRDIKPSNVMIGEFREVWVLDWGLAKQVGEDELTSEGAVSFDGGEGPDLDPLTTGGSVLGTPGFLSPEQARGEHATLDHRTDVFSLGVLLYLLLCDSLPFAGRGRVAVENVAKGIFDRPRKRRPDVSWELEQVVLRAMAYRPEDRFATVDALRGEVQRWVEGQPLATVRYSPARRLGKWLYRHRQGLFLTGVLGAVAGAAAFIGLSTWLWSVLVARDRALVAEQVALVAERDARLSLARGDVQLARAEADLGRLGSAVAHLDHARDVLAAQGGDPRPADLVRSWLAGRFSPPELAVSGDILRGVLSPDGERLAIVSEGGPHRILAVPTGDELWRGVTLAPGDRPMGLWWDGDALTDLVWRGRDLVLIDAADGHVRSGPFRVPDGAVSPLVWVTGGNVVLSEPNVGTIAWSVRDGALLGPPLPDGVVQGLSEDGTVGVGRERRKGAGPVDDASVVWDLRTGRERLRRGLGIGAELSSDGALLAVDEGSTLSVVTAGGEDRWRAEGLPGARLVFTDGDRQLVAVGSDDRFRTFDVATGAILGEHRILGGPNASQGYVSVASGGSRMAVVGNGTLRLWSVEPGFDRPYIEASTRNLTALDVSRDGLLVASAGWDGHVRLWDWRSRSLVRDTLVTEAGVRDVVFSPDGAHWLAAGRDGPARLVDTATGEVVHTLALPDGVAAGGAFVGGRPVALFADGRLAVFDPVRGTPDHVWSGDIHHPWSVVASPDETRLLVVGRSRTEPLMELWDVATRERLHVEPPNGAGYHGAFSPDGRTFVVGTHEGRVFVWATETGEPRVLTLRDEALQAVGFSGDGTQLAVGAYDGQLDLYDALTFAPIQSLPLHARSIVDLSFAPGSATLLTASGDTRIGWLDETRWERLARASRTWTPDAPASPADGDLWLALAEGAALRSNWGRAREALSRAEAAGTPAPPVDRARAAFVLGRFDDARSALDDALERADSPTLRAWREALPDP